MFGLRQKLFFGFGGLLAILLAVSILGVAVLNQHRTWLDKFLYENWRSVEYGQHMLDALPQLIPSRKAFRVKMDRLPVPKSRSPQRPPKNRAISLTRTSPLKTTTSRFPPRM
jgi:hypothetical protein